MLDRLGVQQKLSLLLTLPLTALVVVTIPFVVGRVDDAIGARAIVSGAQAARRVGALVQDLQQERLLGVTALTTPDTDRSAFARLAAASADAAHDLSGTDNADLRRAVADLDGLDAVRQSVQQRTAAPRQVQDEYQRRIAALVDALGLTRQPRADPVGQRQMSALDALLRANEEASRLATGLVVSATDAPAGVRTVAEARVLRQGAVDRFRQQADPDQVALFDLAAQGTNGRRIDQLAGAVGTGPGTPVLDVAAAAQTTVTLSRALQERIVHDIAVRAQGRAAGAELAAGVLIALALTLILVMIWLGVVVSRSVAVPLRRLTNAAGVVADLAHDELFRVADRDLDESRPPKLAAVDLRTNDEIGELATAFNRVQATAALLMEQQVINRHNVSIMFANIALRTRALVARQLAFIDEFERNEQDEQMLAKLYRLDHLTTRLRRSADSLLVVSGIPEDERIATPTPVLDVIRSAVAEIEGYQAVRIGAVCELTVRPQLVPDLRLLLAELLENATAFSPPHAPVEVAARTVGDDCVIVIADHGMGMSPERLAEENRRLVERERIEIAPTSVLGLFVVGRLARRHGLRVELRPSVGQGTTAQVRVPAVFIDGDRPGRGPRSAVATFTAPPPLPSAGRVQDGRQNTDELVRLLRSDGGPVGFDWFDHPPHGMGPPVEPVPAPDPPPAARHASAEPDTADDQPDVTRSGLRRREPGRHLPTFGLEQPSRAEWPTSARDPGAERAELEEFARGMRRAGVPTSPPDGTPPAAPSPDGAGSPAPSRGGLTRRVPGAQLAGALRADGNGAGRQPSHTRDPEAERDALDSFIAGLARAEESPTNR